MKTDSLNSTAYRIFKILQWLQEQPLTLEVLNQRLFAEPLIGRTLSEDSVWLYMNTLRALGCEITRPSPNNGFQYQLLRHPFGINLTPENLHTLIQAKTIAEKHFSYQEILSLDRFFKKILRHSHLPQQEREIEELFIRSRSVDYELLESQIEQLQGALAEPQLLHLTYQSPVKGRERFYFLPEKLMYQNGVLYLRGFQHERDDLIFLRIERISQIEQIEQADLPGVYQLLLEKQASKPKVVIHFHGVSLEQFEPFGMGEVIQAFRDGKLPYVRVTLQTRDVFLLKQKLLSQAIPFEIIEPLSLRNEIHKTLEEMDLRYEVGHG